MNAIEVPQRSWPDCFRDIVGECKGWGVCIEWLSEEMGRQVVAEGLGLQGLSFESNGTQAGNVLVEAGDMPDFMIHHIEQPSVVRIAHAMPGLEADIQIECADGTTTLVLLRRRPELPGRQDDGASHVQQERPSPPPPGTKPPSSKHRTAIRKDRPMTTLPVRLDRGNSLGVLDSVRDDFHILNRLFRGGILNFVGNTPDNPAGYGVDIREDDDHVYVEADLPGFRKEDVTITLEDGTLSIIAEHGEEVDIPAPDGQQNQQSKPSNSNGARARQNGEYLLHERRVQRYVRSFTLPSNVDDQDVEATMENGVLRIVLNKRQEAKAKRIQIT